jgi:hypothetical protein
MPTNSFKQLVQEHVATDRTFAQALLRDGVETLLSGDVDTGKAILRDYIKATVGFEKLGEATGTQPKSLSACLGHGGTHRQETFSASSAICKSAPAATCR